MPTASAIPPSVITLSDWCRILSMMMEVRIDRGIDVMTINVLRQEARNSRIISVLDPVDSRGECPLTYGDDPILHLGRGQPGVGPDDVDDRDVDGGEDIDGRGQDGHDAEDGDQQRQYDERV